MSAPTESVNPVTNIRFAIEIGGEIVAWFTECSGLSVQRETESHEEGGTNHYVHQLPSRIKYSNITLKRGISDQDETLWDWFQKGLYDAKVDRKNVSVLLFSPDRTKAKRWNLENAYPVKWGGPDFNTGGQAVAIETLEFVHHGMQMSGWEQVA